MYVQKYPILEQNICLVQLSMLVCPHYAGFLIYELLWNECNYFFSDLHLCEDLQPDTAVWI